MYIAKVANAFYPRASASKLALSLPGVGAALSKVAGLWIGGRVEITDDGIRFAANKLNMAFNENPKPIWIPINSIRSVELEPGWITKVVVIRHADDVFRFRCFGAAKVVRDVKQHLSRNS